MIIYNSYGIRRKESVPGYFFLTFITQDLHSHTRDVCIIQRIKMETNSPKDLSKGMVTHETR